MSLAGVVSLSSPQTEDHLAIWSLVQSWHPRVTSGPGARVQHSQQLSENTGNPPGPSHLNPRMRHGETWETWEIVSHIHF